MTTVTAEQFFLVGGIIVLALILLGIGIIGLLRSRNPDPAAHTEVASKKPAPEWLRGLADTASKTVTRTPGSPSLPPEAVLLMRDPAAGWVVEVNGIRYTSLKDMHDDRAASQVLEALTGLQDFAGLKPSNDSVARTAPAERLAPAAEQTRLSATPAATPASGGAVLQPTYPAPSGSILDQIEKVLQRNLLRHPELSNRKIHVGAARDGSLLIEVDQQFYPAVNDVPEPDVREVIQASILEWERNA